MVKSKVIFYFTRTQKGLLENSLLDTRKGRLLVGKISFAELACGCLTV